MPRAQQSLEERILNHFRTAPLGEVKLLHKLATSAVRERVGEDAAASSSPARPRSHKPAAGSGNGGKKKKAARRRTPATPPADDEISI
jgi:hypothetical protein